MRPRILFICGRETAYMRNRVLIRAFQQHFDTLDLTSGARNTLARTVHGLARYAAQRPSYDLAFVGFYGYPLVIALANLQRVLRRRNGSATPPILFDAYVSNYDTLCEDRQWFRQRSVAGRFARWLDRTSCQVADRVLLDTQAHARYFVDHLGVPEPKVHIVPVGCDESLFSLQHQETSPGFERHNGEIRVFYYGAYLALHGTEVIVQAAHHLRDRADIHLVIGGDGPRASHVRRMAQELRLDNVEFVGWISLEQLPGYIARSDICLGGHFSTIPKAARVVSTKTFQFIAMRKATIVGDNPATREFFTHGEQVYAVPMGDPYALADAIRTLADDAELRQHVARSGHELFKQRLTTRAIGNELMSIIDDALS